MQLSHEWLLLLGGISLNGSMLNDVQRLHLPTLSWRPPPRVLPSEPPSPARLAARSTMDCSATAGVVVGGVIRGAHGEVIVPRAGLLLPGPPLMGCQVASEGQGGWSTVQGGGGGGGGGLSRQFVECHVKADDRCQRGGGLSSSGCRCGSCCTCMTAAAARAVTGRLQQSGEVAAVDPARSSGSWTGVLSQPSLATAEQLAPRLLPGPALAAPAEMSGQLQECLPCTSQTNSQDMAAEAATACQAATPGSTHTTGSVQSVRGWSTEIDVQPVHVDTLCFRAAAPAGEGARGGSGATAVAPTLISGWHGPNDAAGVEAAEWHLSQPCGQGQGALQLLLAVGVVLLGLVLAYPSLMLQAA
jgi:hypothetical protein